jgi:hypothetical protein
MRNLKKVLTLTLAFVMAFTLMGGLNAGARTDFVDFWQLSENEAQAVDVLSELNIIGGTDSAGTTFNPSGTLTRATMAKLIYVAVNRGVDDLAIRFKDASNPFSDVSTTHWGYGYCVWAQRMGYISGRGVDAAGIRFDPNADVTLIEAARMLLGMLGYDGNQLGFAGSGWETAVASNAMLAGLFPDDFASVLNRDVLTRSQAALIVYTAINSVSVTTHNGRVNPARVVGGRSLTFAEENMDLFKIQGTVLTNDYGTITAGGGEKGITVINHQRESVLAAGGGVTNPRILTFENTLNNNVNYNIPLATGKELLGREAWIFVRLDNNGRVARTFGSVQEVTPATGSYNHNRNTITAAARAGLRTGNRANAAETPIVLVPVYVNNRLLTGNENFLLAEGSNFYLAATTVNEVAGPILAGDQLTRVHTMNSAADITFCGWQTHLSNIVYVTNEDGVVLRVLADDWTYGEVTARTAATGRLSLQMHGYLAYTAMTSANLENVEGFADVAREDKVLIQNRRGTDGTPVWAVKKAETVEGRITHANDNGDANFVRIAGTDYKASFRSFGPTDGGVNRNTRANRFGHFRTLLAGTDQILILDNNGLVIDWKAPARTAGFNYLVMVRAPRIAPTFNPTTFAEGWEVHATVVADDGLGQRTYPVSTYTYWDAGEAEWVTLNMTRSDAAGDPNGDELANAFIASDTDPAERYLLMTYTLTNGRLALREFNLAGEASLLALSHANSPVRHFANVTFAAASDSHYTAGETRLTRGGVEFAVDANSKFFVRGVRGNDNIWTFTGGRPNFNIRQDRNVNGYFFSNRRSAASGTNDRVALFVGKSGTHALGGQVTSFLFGNNNGGGEFTVGEADDGTFYSEIRLISMNDFTVETYKVVGATALEVRNWITSASFPIIEVDIKADGTIDALPLLQSSMRTAATSITDSTVPAAETLYAGYLFAKGEDYIFTQPHGTNEDAYDHETPDTVGFNLAADAKFYHMGWGSIEEVTYSELNAITEAIRSGDNRMNVAGSKHIFRTNDKGDVDMIIYLSNAGAFVSNAGVIRWRPAA